MKLSELAATGGISLPWPTLFGGQLTFASDFPESITCTRKCGAQRLCASEPKTGEHTCAHGMTFFVEQIGDSHATIYGVRGPSNTTTLNRYTRDSFKGRSLSREKVSRWTESVSSLLRVVEREFTLRQSEMLDPLHDPIRLAKQISTIANKLVQVHSSGATLEQQIDNATSELKALVKAAGLLSDSFDLLAIYFNPAAATYGRKVAISLHGLITKLIAIFRIDDGGITRSNARIFLNGSCYRNIFVYESFKLIPFALLSNAVKYSMQGNVEVTVEDRRQTVEFTVESIGPLIEDSERDLIFEKNGRGKWASKFVGGRGVGLYLAATIAGAHGTRISFTSTRTGDFTGEIPLARNRFTLNIATGVGANGVGV